MGILIGFGTELGTAYSELIDPVEQRRRLTEQLLLAAGGRPRGHAARRGLPQRPGIRDAAYGVGLGVDRLVMAFTGNTEMHPFPLVS